MKKLTLAIAFTFISILFVQAQTGNTKTGSSAGASITTGDFNTMVGYIAGQKTTTGSNNLFMGVAAGRRNTSGNSNVFIGRNTGLSNLTGNSNLFMGQSAGYTNTEGSNNVFIGADAGFYETGSNRLYIASGRSNPLLYGEFDNKLLKVNGTLAIGTNNYNDATYKLYVADGIRTEAVQIDAEINWPDYVFAKTYQLPSLNEVDAFIKKNSHLPNVPSAKEINEQGINVANMDATLLRKIEELTLYTLQQNKQINDLNKVNKALMQRLEKLEKMVQAQNKK